MERRYFQILTSIPNLGPKRPWAILSAFPPDRLREIAAREDVKAMTAVSGIGQKSASDRLGPEAPAQGRERAHPTTTARREEKGSEFADALLALKGLGYAEEEVRPMLNEAFEAEPDLDAATAIRAALENPGRETRMTKPAATAPATVIADDTIRPRRLSDFIGQEDLRANLSVFIQAARERGKQMDHTLFYGSPGLGQDHPGPDHGRGAGGEPGVHLRPGAGALGRPGRHPHQPGPPRHPLRGRNPPHARHVEEILYPALEDFKLDLIIGQGPGARTVKIDLEPFTLVGATTRLGLLTSPLARPLRGDPAAGVLLAEELARIVTRAARIMKAEITPDGALAIGGRSRGTPRIAGRLLRRVRDFAEVQGKGKIDAEIAGSAALKRMDVDAIGLDQMDRKILSLIINHFQGGPVGVKDHCRGLFRRGAHHRGHLRALPHPVRVPETHPARPGGHGPGLPAPEAAGREGGRGRRVVAAGGLGNSRRTAPGPPTDFSGLFSPPASALPTNGEHPMPGRILYLCPDLDHPSGGVAAIYEHVRILARHGFPAFVLHFERDAPDRFAGPPPPLLCLGRGLRLHREDLLVVPEGCLFEGLADLRGLRKIAFVQSALYAFDGPGGWKQWERTWNFPGPSAARS